jgi:hypothetical protein
LLSSEKQANSLDYDDLKLIDYNNNSSIYPWLGRNICKNKNNNEDIPPDNLKVGEHISKKIKEGCCRL